MKTKITQMKAGPVINKQINLVSYNKLLWCICFYSPLLLILISLITDSSYIYLFLYIFFFIIISFGLHFILKYYFDEYIILNEKKIIYINSRLFGRKEKIFETKRIIEILYEKESFAVFPGYRVNVILKDEVENKYVVVNEKVAAFFQLNNNLLQELSGFFNAPVKKQSYILSADLKQRREL